MEGKSSTLKNETENADPGHSSLANNSATSPLATQVMTQLFLNKNIPPPPSPVPSDDKTDNRDTFLFSDADLRHEDERLKTFDKWPLTFLSPDQLARNGFYYLGRGDEVRCAFCKVEIMRWEVGDDPAIDHKRWSPSCPLVRKQSASSNGTVDSAPTSGRDECGVHIPPASNASVRMPGPVHPHYASESARLRSFQDWPRCMRQKPEDLAAAGFFYTGQGDKTKCFYCDGGLKDWENDDVPWEQHARWFDRCAYVQLVKGREYVQKVLTEACLIPAPKEEPAPVEATTIEKPAVIEKEKEDDNNTIDDSKVCKICYVEERNVVFVPCGHVVACAKCALSTNKCPMCRRTFRDAVRLYFS
ncbi:death-associated inhibitor of apoptosis 1-like isoform X1 [Ostrinia furnacalis]|uniref:death-associated inhibitor of apoptosis 1-like isoform X1 n=1 Tax=Ostrinia furnacalis TaxID=93504 RepID=UPI00104067C0|nr:death-associated inhibitor of apoptosis 1-like isoform X1 [Ostrinia furnacalis]XP_028156773.1 death-associated inhibitor of apoptosis 1-like isoform X1 [Ostrinia furnacalis]XP_028156779.1 death-associated inhibitor of apoptosis 1-like isoform X1 [Ostrinia furnacalis]